MSPYTCWLVVVFVMTQVIGCLGLTKAQVNAIVPEIRALILDSFTNTEKFEHPILGSIVRLAFHDCAGRDGCDGCLNTTLGANGGLDDIIEFLEDIYQEKSLAPIITRADYWALAGIVAVNMGIENLRPATAVPASLKTSSFKWGRKNCKTSPDTKNDTDSDFPSAILGYTGVLNYFASRFKFTATQTVAIMGAHNLGRAHDEYSGFNDSWTETGKRLGSEYYANMKNPQLKWVQGQVPNGNYKWQPNPAARAKGTPAPPAIMMLDADMAMFKDFGTPAANGKASCSFSGCPLARDTNGLVAKYAADKKLFLKDFAEAFNKMLTVCGRPTIGSVKFCTLPQVV